MTKAAMGATRSWHTSMSSRRRAHARKTDSPRARAHTRTHKCTHTRALVRTRARAPSMAAQGGVESSADYPFTDQDSKDPMPWYSPAPTSRPLPPARLRRMCTPGRQCIRSGHNSTNRRNHNIHWPRRMLRETKCNTDVHSSEASRCKLCKFNAAKVRATLRVAPHRTAAPSQQYSRWVRDYGCGRGARFKSTGA
jgi:hypothetical protein